MDGTPRPKPQISFACLIGMAILDAPAKRMTVSEIYKFMESRYPYFASAGPGWKNLVRHNLSLNHYFCKQSKGDEMGSKGSYWRIRPESLAAVEGAIRKQHETLTHFSTHYGAGPTSEIHPRRKQISPREPRGSRWPDQIEPDATLQQGASMLLAMTSAPTQQLQQPQREQQHQHEPGRQRRLAKRSTPLYRSHQTMQLNSSSAQPFGHPPQAPFDMRFASASYRGTTNNSLAHREGQRQQQNQPPTGLNPSFCLQSSRIIPSLRSTLPRMPALSENMCTSPNGEAEQTVAPPVMFTFGGSRRSLSLTKSFNHFIVSRIWSCALFLSHCFFSLFSLFLSLSLSIFPFPSSFLSLSLSSPTTICIFLCSSLTLLLAYFLLFL